MRPASPRPAQPGPARPSPGAFRTARADQRSSGPAPVPVSPFWLALPALPALPLARLRSTFPRPTVPFRSPSDTSWGTAVRYAGRSAWPWPGAASKPSTAAEACPTLAQPQGQLGQLPGVRVAQCAESRRRVCLAPESGTASGRVPDHSLDRASPHLASQKGFEPKGANSQQRTASVQGYSLTEIFNLKIKNLYKLRVAMTTFVVNNTLS